MSQIIDDSDLVKDIALSLQEINASLKSAAASLHVIAHCAVDDCEHQSSQEAHDWRVLLNDNAPPTEAKFEMAQEKRAGK